MDLFFVVVPVQVDFDKFLAVIIHCDSIAFSQSGQEVMKVSKAGVIYSQVFNDLYDSDVPVLMFPKARNKLALKVAIFVLMIF